MDGGARSMDRDPIHGSMAIFYPRVACSIFKSPQAFISSLSVAPHPLFPCYWPTHPWIFQPIRGFSSTSTSNRIDEYVQRSIDGVPIHAWGLSTSRVQHIHHDLRRVRGTKWKKTAGHPPRWIFGLMDHTCSYGHHWLPPASSVHAALTLRGFGYTSEPCTRWLCNSLNQIPRKNLILQSINKNRNSFMSFFSRIPPQLAAFKRWYR